MIDRTTLPYRQSTLAVVTNGSGKYLVVNKNSYDTHQWSFPGGGVDEGETPEVAVMRELVEELGSDKFEIQGQSKHIYTYEWPEDIIESVHTRKGKYFRGTTLTQFMVLFTGDEAEVKAGDGIRAVKWINREELKSHLVFANQLENAEQVIQEFESQIIA